MNTEKDNILKGDITPDVDNTLKSSDGSKTRKSRDRRGFMDRRAPGKITIDVKHAVHEAQLLVAYTAEAGIDVNQDYVNKIIESKFAVETPDWNATDEVEFWMAYNYMANTVKPVTIVSLNATKLPTGNNAKKSSIMANKVARNFRIFALVSLLALLGIQIYWIIGVKAIKKISVLFSEENHIKEQRDELLQESEYDELLTNKKDDRTRKELKALNVKLSVIQQEMDANYELLCSWNSYWLTALFKDRFEGKVNPYRESSIKAQIINLEEKIKKTQSEIKNGDTPENIAAIETTINKLKRRLQRKRLKLEQYKSRNQYFLNNLAAEYTLSTIEQYILPLLYGLLGAFMYVLRTLSKEIKVLSFSPEVLINYRLRLTMGSLAGLIIGWFFAPKMGSGMGAVTTLSISFLAGYNVEILFSLLDKLISYIAKDGGPLKKKAVEVPAQS